MTSPPGKQTIEIHVSHNISRSKENHTMQFGQLIEYNMKNIFLKIIHKMWGETIPRPLSKKSKLSKQYVLIVCQVEVNRNILKISRIPHAFTSHKAFSKSKKRSGTSLPTSLSE